MAAKKAAKANKGETCPPRAEPVADDLRYIVAVANATLERGEPLTFTRDSANKILTSVASLLRVIGYAETSSVVAALSLARDDVPTSGW